MIYEIGFSRDKELKAFYNSDVGKAAIKELNLAQIAAGDETTIWKPLSNGWYALVCSRKISDSNIDRRTIPIAAGILMEQEEARFFLDNKYCFIYAVEVLKDTSYEEVVSLPERKSEESEKKWFEILKNMPSVKYGVINNKDKQYWLEISKAIIHVVTSSKKIYLKRCPSLYEFLQFLRRLPFSVQMEISFSHPFGGTPAGAMQLNFVQENYQFDPTADGFPVGEYLTDEDLIRTDENLDVLAEELNHCVLTKEYRQYLSQYSMEEMKKVMGFVHTLREIDYMLENREDLPQDYCDFIQKNWRTMGEYLPLLGKVPPSKEFLRLCEYGPYIDSKCTTDASGEEGFDYLDEEDDDDYPESFIGDEYDEDDDRIRTRNNCSDHKGNLREKCYQENQRKGKKQAIRKLHKAADAEKKEKLFRVPVPINSCVSGLILCISLLLSGMIQCNYIKLNSDVQQIVLHVTERNAIQLLLLQTLFQSFWSIFKWIFAILGDTIKNYFIEKKKIKETFRKKSSLYKAGNKSNEKRR